MSETDTQAATPVADFNGEAILKAAAKARSPKLWFLFHSLNRQTEYKEKKD